MAEGGAGWIDAMLQAAHATSAIELAAVASGFLYIVLAIRARRACWIAGGVSSALYIAVLAEASLTMQALLQVGYVCLSGYGWWIWRPGSAAGDRPVSWPRARHGVALLAVAAVTSVQLALFARTPLTAAAIGDVLGTWASVAATWMLARRCRESWLWWIVIDGLLAALFASQRLAFTAALYLAYAALAVTGWRSWRRAGAAA